MDRDDIKAGRLVLDGLADNAPVKVGSRPGALDEARMQWQFGDWRALAAYSMDATERTAEREKLALLVACAHQHLGNLHCARNWLEKALEWGCEKEVAARIMVSSLHVTLGRAAYVKGDRKRALEYFKESVKGVSGDLRLAYQARTTTELARLGYLRDAAMLVQDSHNALLAEQFKRESFSLRHSEMLTRQKHDRIAPPRLILVAGMRHSGSTALFNIVRLALEQAEMEYRSGYAENAASETLLAESSDVRLVKIHEYRDDFARAADLIVTARRDLRDSVASAARREFPGFRAHGGAVGYAKYNRLLHDIWVEKSDYEFSYERFMREPITEIGGVLRLLGLTSVDAESVFEAVVSLPTDAYQTTLLSPIHVTDPDRVHSYADTLAEEEVDKIEKQHFDWLSRYRYPFRREGKA